MRTTSRFVQFRLGVSAAMTLLVGCSESRTTPLLPTQITRPATQPLADHGYRVLYSFKGGSDASNPTASLIAVDGVLYGTTMQGGSGCYGYECGTVFKVSTSGTETVLYSFAGGTTDGEYPYAGLLNLDDNLYGTTEYGGGGCGGYGCGTVFAVSTSGKERVLHSFNSRSDGANPLASLIAVNGALFGTTPGGGSGSCKYSGRAGCGTAFAMSTTGKERLLHGFKGGSDGAKPFANLIALNGVLYGTTTSGGLGYGTVFKMNTAGAETVLYRFKGGATDGAAPAAGLTDLGGRLYGTTSGGGSGCSGGCGTVFALSTSGKERVLHNFEGYPRDGADPQAGLVAVNGALYGTTTQGGASCRKYGGCGTVFKITTAGKEDVLHSFKGTPDGWWPLASLLPLDSDLYGTTSVGGTGCLSASGGGCGTVFRISP